MIDKKQISWINGQWGASAQLTLPLQDRGLIYADGIFETILISEGKALLLSEHLQRWQRSAIKLGMDKPPEESWLKPLIKEAIEKCSLQKGYGVLRLNWSRGSNNNRGIEITSNTPSNRFWMNLTSIIPCFQPLSTMISCHEKRNAKSKLNSFKTFAYGQAIQAKREAQGLGYDDALLENTNGEMCCGTTANIIIKRHNEFLTPPLKSGCLPGIMRQQGIKHGVIKEAEIENQPLKDDQWLLINSLSCRPISKINQTYLDLFTNPKQFWLSLYSKSSLSIKG